MKKTEVRRPSARSAEDQPVICDRSGRLDPARLERAVGLLLGGRPELAGASGEPAAPGAFIHLDLSGVPAPERPSAEHVVPWVMRRCLDRSGETPFMVAYVDAGSEEPGRLILAGNRSALSDGEACRDLAEALLALYGELDPGPVARSVNGRKEAPTC